MPGQDTLAFERLIAHGPDELSSDSVDLYRSIKSPRKVHVMFTPSDIVVFILLIGSGILIWIARRSNSTYQKDAPSDHDHENPPSAEQMESLCETNNHASHGQSKNKDASCNGNSRHR